MKLKHVGIIVVSVLAMSSAAVSAAEGDESVTTTVNGGVIHFKGEVVNAACAIDSESMNQTVELGQVRSSRLAKAGDLSSAVEMVFSTPVMIKLISAAFTLGFAYAAWNVGILHGNVTIMAVGSYFTPVLSSALAAVLLSAPLSFSFWQGALMVCGGSLLCWLATRRG